MDAFKGSDGTGGKARIVTPLHDRVDGIGTEHGDTCILCQGQCLVLVLEQHHAFSGHVECQLLVGVTCYDALRDFRPGIQVIAVEVAQLKAGDEQTAQALVEVGLLDVATAHGHGQVFILRSALNVGASQDGLG